MVQNAVCDPLRTSDLALCAGSAVAVVGPIWRGAFDTLGSYNGSLNGLGAFMPKTSYSKVVKIVRAMPPSLCFRMKKRHELWPKNFDALGAADFEIGLYIFPEFSRNEKDYNSLVEYMIANDLAMKAHLTNLELAVFTSLEISSLEKRQIQGTYYLWGMVRKKGSSNRAVRCPEKPSIHPGALSLIQIGTEFNQWSKHKKNIEFRQRCSSMSSIRPECRRARSKRGKKRNAQPRNEKEAIVLHGLHHTFGKSNHAETCTIVEAIHQEECQSHVTVEKKASKTVTVDGFAVTIPGEQKNASLLNDMIDTSKNNAKGKASEIEDRSYGQDPEEQPVSPLRASAKEKSVSQKALGICEDSCSILDTRGRIEETISDKVVRQLVLCKQQPDISPTLRQIMDECIGDVQNGISEGKLETEQPSWENGPMPLAVLLPLQKRQSPKTQAQGNHQNTIESQVSDANKPPTDDDHQLDTHLEKSSCSTLVLDLEEENSGATCPSIAPTLPLELDAEDATISGSESLRKTSVLTIPVSITEMESDYHDTSSNCVKTKVGQYHIKSDLAPVLQKILEKYGDIALGCPIEPEGTLENICKVVQDLESVHLSGLRHYHVACLKNVLQVADALGINVKWLYERCEELEKLASGLSQYPTLKGQVAQSKKDVERKEEMLIKKRVALAKLQAEIQLVKEDIESMKKIADKLNCDMLSFKTMSGNFHGKSVVDGLL